MAHHFLSLSFQDLEVGARSVTVYVDGRLAFAGELPRSCGTTDPGGSTTIDLQQSSPLPPEEQAGRAWSQQPGGSLWTPDSAAEETETTLSLLQVEACPPVPSGSVAMEHVESPSSPETPELVHSGEEWSLSEQTDRLSGRRRTPMPPPPCAKSKSCSAAEELPLWLESEAPVVQLPPEARRRVSPEAAGESPSLRPAELERGCRGAVGTDAKLPAVARGVPAANSGFLHLLTRKSSSPPEQDPPGRQRGKEGSSNDCGGKEAPRDRGEST